MESVFGFLGVIIGGLLSLRYLSRKDKIEWIEKSYPQSQKLYELAEELNNSRGDDLQKFKEFRLYLQHLCIMILSEAIPEKVFKYKYYPFLKMLVESDFIKITLDNLQLPFEKEEYNYLFDAYKMGKRKFGKNF